jgi:hypothetical protein
MNDLGFKAIYGWKRAITKYHIKQHKGDVVIMRKGLMIFILAVFMCIQLLYPKMSHAADVWAYDTDGFTYYVVSESVVDKGPAFAATIKFTDASGYAWTNYYKYRWANAGFWWVCIGENGDRYPVEKGSREDCLLKVITDIAKANR